MRWLISYYPAGGDVVCFGINLCNGQMSAVHVSLPPDADTLVQQLPVARLLLSSDTDTLKPGSVYKLAIKGSLQTSMDTNGVLTSLQITGQAGINVPSVQDVRRLNIIYIICLCYYIANSNNYHCSFFHKVLSRTLLE